MTLTRKDFIALAREIRNIFFELDLTDSQKETIIARIGSFCSSQNGLFDYNRFMNACLKEE